MKKEQKKSRSASSLTEYSTAKEPRHTPSATQSNSASSSEIDWLRGVMAEAPWLLDQRPRDQVIRAYVLPGAEERASERPVPDPRQLLRQLTDLTVNGQGLKQRIAEYVQAAVSQGDVPHGARTARLTTESCEAMRLATDLVIAFSRVNNSNRASGDHAHWELSQSGLNVVREFAALAKDGNHDAVFYLIRIAEEAIAGLEAGSPQLEAVVKAIAPAKEQWPQLCGALPADRDRVHVRLSALGVGTKTPTRKTYSGRGRPISYDPIKTPVNVVAESLIQYVLEVRRQCAMATPGSGVDSEISQALLNGIAALPDFVAASANEWVRVAEEIVMECCGLKLEDIPGLVTEEARRNYERRRAAGDELFESEIRDNVRASLVQSFKTIALPGAR